MTYQPRLKVLPQDMVTPFQTMTKAIIARLGSEREAAKFIGVSRTVLEKLRTQSYLTEKQARLILDGHKRMGLAK